jgi:hypothetical protein
MAQNAMEGAKPYSAAHHPRPSPPATSNSNPNIPRCLLPGPVNHPTISPIPTTKITKTGQSDNSEHTKSSNQHNKASQNSTSPRKNPQHNPRNETKRGNDERTNPHTIWSLALSGTIQTCFKIHAVTSIKCQKAPSITVFLLCQPLLFYTVYPMFLLYHI